MKKNFTRLMPVLIGMFLYSGCAKQQVVRPDQPIASPASSASSVAKPQASAPSKPEDATKVGQGSVAAAALPASSAAVVEQGGALQGKDRGAAAVSKDLEKIYFDFDSATLSESSRKTLTASSELLKQNPQVKLRIEGHCDERGSDDYNLALSERRAQAAQRYLTALGIPEQRLSTIGYGKERPANPGHDQAALAANRRDEFVPVK